MLGKKIRKHDKGNLTVMHPLWKLVWAVWSIGIFYVWATLLAGFTEHVYMFYWYVVFMPIEMHGAAIIRWDDAPKGERTKMGDTYSEFNWWVTRRLPARHQMTKMIAWAHGASVYMLFFLFDDWQWSADDFTALNMIISTPWLLVSIGLAKWLTPHFGEEGDRG